jgi:hypothetical protein
METTQQFKSAETDSNMTPEVIGGLSLSEITTRFGTSGLALRTRLSLDQNGLWMVPGVPMAFDLAVELHGDQQRTNGVHLDHIFRNTVRVVDYFGFKDADMAIATLLHDGPEDQAQRLAGKEDNELSMQEIQSRAFDILEKRFGARATDLIRSVTNDQWSQDESVKNCQYLQHKSGIAWRNSYAFWISLADFIDNAVGNHYTVGPKQRKFDIKHLPLYSIFIAGVVRNCELVAPEVSKKAMLQLGRGYVRALARLNEVDSIAASA